MTTRGTFSLTGRARARARGVRLLVLIALSLGHPPLARAQTASVVAPANLPTRRATFAWDQDLLRAGFSWEDVLQEPAVKNKLASGTANTIAMRAVVLREGETTPVMLVVQTCRVTLDLWENIYKIQVETAAGTTERLVLPGGVERYCGKVQDFPIVSKSSLKAGAAHFLEVIVDVNPVNDDMKAQMQRWMRRPLGASDVGGGDSMFSGLVLLFMRDVGGSDRTLQFRTQTFVP